MPALPSTTPPNPLLLQLAGISEMISQNTDAAAHALQQFTSKHHPFKHKPVKAQAELLKLIIASVRNNFMQQGIDDKKLLAYFKAERKFDEAGQLLLARARHFFLNGNLAEGEKILEHVRAQLLDKLSPRVEIVYLTRIAFVHGRKHQYKEQLQVNLQALDKLKGMNETTAWHNNIATVFYTNIANCYIANGDFKKAWPYLEKSLKIAGSENVSTYNRFNVYSYFAFYHEGLNDHRQSAAWHEKIITLLTGDTSHQTYLLQSYLMATVQYYLHYRKTALSKAELAGITAKQEKYLRLSAKLIQPDLSNGNYLQWLYATATLQHQKGNYKKAITYLNRCLPLYIKMQHHVSVLNCTRLAHEIYAAWGRQTADAKKLYKAYELKQQESEMVEAASRQSHLQQMEAVQVKYDLQQAELNSQLLQQQVEAMNKEVQLTALNLQEKIALLDELKEFVLSLKGKENAPREFVKTITQKIGTVKITQQDKAVLQQKIEEGNQQLLKTVAARYPALTPHEVRTCALIKTGLTDKELSKLYGVGARSYEQLRHRIKKKMKLQRTDNLVKHLLQLSTG
jgi:tetratricopeptide (TPR) repeat protein